MPKKESTEESAYDELMSDPMLPPENGGDLGDTAYDKALAILTETGDDPLELMTRTTPIISHACAISYTMTSTFRSSYVSGRINQVMRLAVSYGGRGREEIVKSLGANSGAFGVPSGAESSFMPATED